MIPFEDIKIAEDRSWTLRLVQLLIAGDAPERDEIVETLSELQDDRIAPILTPIVMDTTLPADLRDAASIVASNQYTNEDTATRLSWWQSGDEILQRHAIRCAEEIEEEEEFVYKLASDPNDPFYKTAIQKLEYLCRDEERYLRLSSTALSDPDPQIRQQAAKNLLFPQPIFAEPDLIKATLDPDATVSEEALITLSYYKSQTSIRHLFDVQNIFSDTCTLDIDAIREMLSDVVLNLELLQNQPAAYKYYDQWLEPIRDLLALYRPKSGETIPSINLKNATLEKIDCDQVIALLQNPDSERIQLYCRFYYQIDWHAFDESSRKRLTAFFMSEKDATATQMGVAAMAAWHDTDNLLKLSGHWHGDLARSAACHLKQCPPSLAAAERLWEMVCDAKNRAAKVEEILQSFAHHCDKTKLPNILIDLALHDERRNVQHAAIFLLSEIEPERLPELMPLLSIPSNIDYDLHRLLLRGLSDAEIKVPRSVLADLSEVDDFDLQMEIAKQLD